MNDFSKQVEDGCLLTAGTIECFNTMTIGWALIGTLWGKKSLMVFVRPSRYTFDFMEKNEFFTVSFYDQSFRKEIAYLGSKSGRDVNKVKEVGFHPYQLEKSVSFKEAKQTYLCKKIYFQDMNEHQFNADILSKYYSENDIHRLYVGEIIIKK